MHASELWSSESASARILRAGLTPASWLYALGWQGYLATYSLGLKKAKEPHRPVICVGNLQVGGSGKTPFCRFLVSVLQGMGREVALSCSGYGSPRSEMATHAPEGPLRAQEWGDEAAMFRWLNPDLPLIVGRNRVAAAQIAHESHPDAVLVLDDGFQHLPLKKQVSIVLDPASPKNTRCLPAGPYREPRSNRKRADLVVPGEFEVVAEATTLETPEGESVRPQAYSVLCALGRPEQFVNALADAIPNLEGVSSIRLLADHDPLTAGNLFDNLSQEIPIVVTAKDWVKLRDREDIGQWSILIAKQEIHVTPVDQFASWLGGRLNV